MPRLFPDDLTIVEIQQVLVEQQQRPYRAIASDIDQFTTSKGIYFWYIDVEGYQQLMSNCGIDLSIVLKATPVLDGKYLVYLGTAGIKKGANGPSGLRDRLRWHIHQKHTKSTVCQRRPALSTLRTTIASLLANDLIEVEGVYTEQLVNEFMAQHFIITCISYSGEIADIKSCVDADEAKLIRTINPVLNLSGNQGYIATQISQKRAQILTATRRRLNFNY